MKNGIPCGWCGNETRPDDGDREFVEVKAGRSVVTGYEGGYPATGHLALTFSAVYCSLRCAAEDLAETDLKRKPGIPTGETD